jgi:hypothetical protein
MKKSPYQMPDSFGLLPLYDLLPLEGDLTRLAAAHDSLYARLERVRELRIALGGGKEHSAVQAEENMLNLFANWVSEGLSGK